MNTQLAAVAPRLARGMTLIAFALLVANLWRDNGHITVQTLGLELAVLLCCFIGFPDTNLTINNYISAEDHDAS